LSRARWIVKGSLVAAAAVAVVLVCEIVPRDMRAMAPPGAAEPRVAYPDATNPDLGFPCYGACGASCDCRNPVQRVVKDAAGCEVDVLECDTAPFCRWHDTCYVKCQEQHGGSSERTDDTGYAWCIANCDLACFHNGPAAQSVRGFYNTWLYFLGDPEHAPGYPPPETFGALQCGAMGDVLGLARWIPTPADGRLAFASAPRCP